MTITANEVIASFEPHKYISGVTHAIIGRFSILHGDPTIRGYEIMHPDGEVTSGHSLLEVVKIINSSKE